MSDMVKVRALRTVTAHGLARGDVKEVDPVTADRLIQRGWAERVETKAKKSDKSADEG